MYKLTNLNACYNPFGRFVYTCAQLTTEIVLYCLPKPLAFSCILSNWPRELSVVSLPIDQIHHEINHSTRYSIYD